MRAEHNPGQINKEEFEFRAEVLQRLVALETITEEMKHKMDSIIRKLDSAGIYDLSERIGKVETVIKYTKWATAVFLTLCGMGLTIYRLFMK